MMLLMNVFSRSEAGKQDNSRKLMNVSSNRPSTSSRSGEECGCDTDVGTSPSEAEAMMVIVNALLALRVARNLSHQHNADGILV